MARGRKRKTGPREPNGRPQRPTAQKQNDMERLRQYEIKSVVLAQPHRRGREDARLASCLGDFMAHHRLSEAIYRGAEEFAGVVMRWRAAKGVPTPIRLGEGGSGPGPSDATVRGWETVMKRVDGRLQKELGHRAWVVTRELIVDDRLSVPVDPATMIEALRLVAVEMSVIDANDHPFQSRAA